MFSGEQDGVGAKRTSCSGGRETRLRRSIFARHALQRPGVLAASLTTGFLIGIAYRYFVYDPTPGNLANYVRSGIHGAGLALTARVVQTAFASNTRSSLGLALRRLPLWGELLVRALVMTAALIVVGVSLQLVLYAEPLGLHGFTSGWFTSTLPRIVAIGFAISLVFGALTEIGRLIGGPVLTSVILGTYHRPVREELIVMFLDIAGSTWVSFVDALSETDRASVALGEARRVSDRYSSIARFRAITSWGAPKVCSLAEVSYFAGLRKAGIPEE